MSFTARGWLAFCVFAWVGCFSEFSDTDDDDADDESTGNTSDPTSTTTVDPSVTTSMTSAPTTSATDATSNTDPSVDSSGTSDSDPSTTTDPTGSCVGPGDDACNDGVAVVGELCFLEPQTKAGGDEQIGALAIHDIDDDGDLDVAFTDGADGFVSFGVGGELQNAGAIAGGQPTWSVDIGPLGDEIAVAFGAPSAEVHIVRFDGMSFTMDAPIAAPGIFATARFADLDGDNRLDVLVGAEDSTTLFLHLNDGFDVFGGELEMIDVGEIQGVADMRFLPSNEAKYPGLAILTRDGRLIWTPPSDEGLGDFLAIDPAQTYGNPTTGHLATGDLDADGDADVAVGFDGRAFVFRASDIGYMAVQTVGDGATGNVVPAIADVDNDGMPDLLIADPDEQAIEIYVADGNGFAEADAIQALPMPRGVGVADFNQDCAADVVALGPAWFDVSVSNP